jgi:hypothetical protein
MDENFYFKNLVQMMHAQKGREVMLDEHQVEDE